MFRDCNQGGMERAEKCDRQGGPDLSLKVLQLDAARVENRHWRNELG
jgi:hypothetical protein